MELQTRGSARREAEKEEQLCQGFLAMTKELFVPTESAWRRQRSYMRYHLTMQNTSVALTDIQATYPNWDMLPPNFDFN